MGFFRGGHSGGLGDRPRRPADDGDNHSGQNGKQQHCQTPGCGRWIEAGVTFCWECALQRLRWAAFDGGDDGATPPTAVLSAAEKARAQEQLIREHAAPLLGEADLDDACPWCRRVKAELGLPLRASAPAASDLMIWRGVCAAHRTRGRAFIEMRALLEQMRVRDHLPSESIAAYYEHGYLGPLLEELQDFE